MTLPVALLAWLAAACAPMVQAERPVTLPDPPRQAVEETSTTVREHNRILAAYGGAYEDAQVQAVLDETVDRLVAASERPDLRYRVTILNSPAVNAFALPTGQLYVTRGLLALANDRSELASVLSHEMAHVIARHATTREDQVRQAAIVNRVVSDVLNDPQMGALALAKSKIALANFSRAQELEADGIGVGIAARAGFDAYGATRFLTAMGRNAEIKPLGAGSVDPRYLDFLSSHPSTPERVKIVQTNARQYSAPGGAHRDRSSYLASLDGLVYGEDPSEGFVRGRRFLHPKLGFAFTAPDGFVLDNTAQAVLGVKDAGQALRFDVVRVPAEQSLSDYLTSGAVDNVDPRSVEELTINDLPAATAVAKGEQWSFRLYAIRLGSDVYRFIFAAKQRTAEMDRSFRESVATFRRMTPSEIAKARPLRLKIVTVHAGDTAERFAARMVLADRALERFLVLNGLQPGAPLKPGESVKIVVE